MPMQNAETPQLQDPRAVYLQADDLKLASSILYLAYHDDPLFKQIFRAEKEGYENRLRAAIREELMAFWDAEQPMIGLFDEDRLLAVSCLMEPDTGFGPERLWHWRLKMLLTAGFFGTRQMLEKEKLVQKAIPADTFHMLSFIGVHPDAQHKGLGHILLGAIDTVLLEHKDSQGVGVLVTVPGVMDFFGDDDYTLVSEINVGHIHGHVMFRARPD